MDQIIAFANHKGGVGKTTSAVNIAAVLAEQGKKVLLVDLDPQGSTGLHLGVRDDGGGILRALEKTTALPVVATAVSGVYLVPSGPALAGAAQKFTGAIGSELLRRCLMRTQGEWELLLIDCPPSSGILTVSALLVSRHVVIPTEANPLALNGLYQLLDVIASLERERLGPRLLGIIACRANPRLRIHRNIMKDLEEAFPGRLAPYVRENVAVAEAPLHGRPVTLHAPKSSGADDYRRVTAWLCVKLGEWVNR